MVFNNSAIGQIDSRLLIFKSVFDNYMEERSRIYKIFDYESYLSAWNQIRLSRQSIIVESQIITEYLIEFLVSYEKNIEYDKYSSTYEDFINECSFIPQPCIDFILIIHNYRTFSNHEEYLNILDKAFLPFLEAFYYILDWFNNFHEFNNKDDEFEQVDSTIKFLKTQINSEKLFFNNAPDLDEEKTKDMLKQKEERYNEIHVLFRKRRNVLGQLDKNKSNEKSKGEVGVVDEGVLHCPAPPEIPMSESEIISKLESRCQELQDLLKEVLKNQENQTQQLNIIKNKVDQLLEQLKELNNDIGDYQELIEISLENAHSEDEIDKIINKFCDKCVNKIINSTKNNIDDYDKKQAEDELINSLGINAWNKLSNQSKTFLTTSKITYWNLQRLDDIIDYSGVCLLVTKALEVELTSKVL